VNLSPLLQQSKTFVLLDPTAHDGESALDLLGADDTHVCLVVLMHGHSSEALHKFADVENIDLASAASIYLDQVAERIDTPDRVVETLVSGGSDPASEFEYLAAHHQTRRVLVPSSLQRHELAGFERFPRAQPTVVVRAAAGSASTPSKRWDDKLRSVFPWFGGTPESLKKLSFADQVPTSELRRLSKLGTVVEVAASTEVIGQGGDAQMFLVVIDGSFTVVRDGDVIADLGPGQIAGEMAMLNGSNCNASVVASADARVLELGPREFSAMLETCPGINQQVQQTARGRLTPAA
jgi:hypothetical protein